MSLGAYPCMVIEVTKAMDAYGQAEIQERHRHRPEVNKEKFAEFLVEAGLVLSGLSPDESLVEIVEIADHPWFLGCQFHPEFKSNPMHAHPLFRDFIKASLDNKK